MKSRDGTATTVFAATIGIRAWRGPAFPSVVLTQRCVDRAFRAKIRIGVLAVGLGLSGFGSAFAQEIETPATSADRGLASDPQGQENSKVRVDRKGSRLG